MAYVWVKLNTMKSISHHGTMKTYHPGDWVEVGKHDARQWVEDGSATIMRSDVKTQTFDFADCGIVLTGGEYNPSRQAKLEVEVKTAPPLLQFPKTMLYDATFKRINHELIPVGFKMLDTWQIAVPVSSYTKLACHIGTDHDREVTKKVVHDLRCLVHDPRFMFIRKCPDMERLLCLWKDEQEKAPNIQLAFLRALYQVKPLVNHLPITWIGERL